MEKLLKNYWYINLDLDPNEGVFSKNMKYIMCTVGIDSQQSAAERCSHLNKL